MLYCLLNNLVGISFGGNMSTNNWVIKHLEFAQKAEDKEEMIYRIQAIIDRLNVSKLEK